MVAGTLGAAAMASVPVAASARCEAQVDLHHDDVLAFGVAQQLIDEGRTPEEAATWYFENGSLALQAFARVSGATPERLAARLRSHPLFYRKMADSISKYLERSRAIADIIGSLCLLVPTLRPKPIYLLVGTMDHGATPRELVPEDGEDSLVVLIPVKLVSMFADIDMSEFPDGTGGRGGPERLAGLVSHEMTHVAQVQLQGLEEYRRIYREPQAGTALAYAVREGAADLMAYKSGGGMLARHRYVLENREQLWSEFQEIMHKPVREAPGWFSGSPKEGRPRALGYGIGFDICMAFLARAGGWQAISRESRIRELLSASRSDDFARVARAYGQLPETVGGDVAG